jgi:hypothetical protein
VHTAVSDNAPPVARSQPERIAFIALSAAVIALWILEPGYHGVMHDANLYTVQALAWLQPEVFGSDIYLRFGSQDRFTFFSPLYGTLISLLGLEPAAQLLTLLSQIAFIAAAAFVARQLLPARIALFSVALLIAVPSEYGPGDMFHVVEPFITPRMAAEACVLAALAAMLSKKRVLAGALIVAGLLVHPLMAMAGVAMILALTVALPRPRLAATLGGAVVVALALAAFLVPSVRIDAAWRALILDRMPYVFLSEWSLESLSRACLPLVALTVALLVMRRSRVYSIAAAALIMGLSGLALTVYGSDILHITLVTQSQSWRWLWLTQTLAILLTPLILSACWQRGNVGRATVAVLLSMWLFRYDAYGLVLMPVALGLAVMSRSATANASSAARMLWFGSLIVLAFAFAWALANNALSAGAINQVGDLSDPIRLFRGVAEDGLAPMTLLVVVWLAIRAGGRAVQTGAAVAVCALCLLLLPSAFKEWTELRYPKSTVDAFGAWRAQIPPGTEVLWTDTPIDGWILLQRPAYLSNDQTASTLFSRQAAFELERRDALMTKYFPEAHVMLSKTTHKPVEGLIPTLERACASGELTFIATRYDLKATPLAISPPNAPAFQGLRLYRCGGSNG